MLLTLTNHITTFGLLSVTLHFFSSLQGYYLAVRIEFLAEDGEKALRFIFMILTRENRQYRTYTPRSSVVETKSRFYTSLVAKYCI